jgi:FtsP/CotA-like multicopper oxidase with cupredoxin domain
MRSNLKVLGTTLLIGVATFVSAPAGVAAVIDDAADLATQQAQEKQELNEMRQEIGNIKGTTTEATQGMEQLRQQVQQQRRAAQTSEVHLIAKEGSWEVAPGASTAALTYNGQEPGPVVRVKEGESVRIVLHNQMKVPTSLYFHGMALPHNVGGLPRKEAGLVAPGQTYAFDFVATKAGTYWYHPQVMHGDQMAKGLYGVIVVEARSHKTYDKDVVLVLGQMAVAPKGATYFTVNGKSAPAIPPIEVRNGERVRLRLVNASNVACPLFLTGHNFEVINVNGGDGLEPKVTRDTVTLQPGDRYDVEFTADNPGVWSLASVLASQTNNDGKFPGGIAVVVRYPEALPLR